MNVEEKDYEVTLKSRQIVDMELIFTPTEVASYEFELPLIINKQSIEESFFNFESQEKDGIVCSNSSPMPSEFVSSPTPTRRSSKYNRGSHGSSAILNSFVPKRNISAIALRHALEISDLKVEFKIPITYLETLKDGGFYEAKSIFLTNRSHRPVKWCLDMRKSNKILEEGNLNLIKLTAILS